MKISIALALLTLSSIAHAEGAGGITWTAPTSWHAQPPRQMRVATYTIAHAKADTDDAELAIFYFGQGQGGTVDANITRWSKQFEGSKPPVTKQQKLGTLEATRVEIAGTFGGGMGPMAGAQPASKPGWKLLGAIVDAGQGPVFFKLTGPAATVESARTSFDKLLRSITKP